MIKKVMVSVICLMLIFNSTFYAFADSEVLFGDINGDGKITVEDVAKVRIALLDAARPIEAEIIRAKALAEPFDILDENDLETVRQVLLNIKQRAK